MKPHKCLYCYQPLPDSATDFHSECSKHFFGTELPPILELTKERMEELAKDIVKRSIAVTGVQPKLSLDIEPQPGDPKKSRFTIVGLLGHFILKPPTPEFPHLPENEDLTMHLANFFEIPTADHSLIRLASGELAYITKRFDRVGTNKLAMEDMCQLTETLTEDKYRGSIEKIGKCIFSFASRPGLSAISLFELTLFCFLTGNADMHLKNFSLLVREDSEIILAPAYDLVCTKIAIPEDNEEFALTINGRKRKLTRRDFDALAKSLKIPNAAVKNIYFRFSNKAKASHEWIGKSFLPKKMKAEYNNIVRETVARLEL